MKNISHRVHIYIVPRTFLSDIGSNTGKVVILLNGNATFQETFIELKIYAIF